MKAIKTPISDVSIPCSVPPCLGGSTLGRADLCSPISVRIRLFRGGSRLLRSGSEYRAAVA